MKILRKLFGGIELSWKMLLIYALVNGAVVGLLNCVPFLENTSFVYPAAMYEYWIVAALFVIMNCKNSVDAMLKTFVFFLISQPLIYLVEVPFKALGWELFRYYLLWIIPTILTIPGAFIAYQVKRDNVLSAVILSIATGVLLAFGVGYAMKMVTQFPYGLVAVIFCLGFGIIFIHILLKQKKTKLIAYVCSIAIAVVLILLIMRPTEKTAGVSLDTEHQWTIVEADTDAEIENGFLRVTAMQDGDFFVTVENENSETVVFEAVFDNNSILIKEAE